MKMMASLFLVKIQVFIIPFLLTSCIMMSERIDESLAFTVTSRCNRHVLSLVENTKGSSTHNKRTIIITGTSDASSTSTRTRTSTELQMSKNDNNRNSEPPLTSFLDKLSKTGIDNSRIQRDSLVVAKYDVPHLGIFADQTYQLQSIYAKGMNVNNVNEVDNSINIEANSDKKGVIETIQQDYLDLSGKTNYIPTGYTLYITLYSKMYHDNDTFGNKGVITTPEEVGLVSFKDEVLDSVIVAIPILSFWLGTCFTFSNWYTGKYGGTFMDALLRK